MAATLLNYTEKLKTLRVVQLTSANQSDILTLVRQYYTVDSIVKVGNSVNFNINGVPSAMSTGDYVCIDSNNILSFLSAADLAANWTPIS